MHTNTLQQSFLKRWKDIYHEVALMYWALRKQYRAKSERLPRRTLLCYPSTPDFFHVLFLIARRLNIELTNKPVNAEAVIAFNDTTSFSPDSTLLELARQRKVLNIQCTDIRKSRVDEIFTAIFGYSITLDPRTYKGKCLQKSEYNATHDGQIVECPCEPLKGHVYQKIIDNTDGKEYFDIRVFIARNTIPFVFKKVRCSIPEKRFGLSVANRLHETNEMLSVDEVEKILKFCSSCGLDWGELDVVRESGTGKLYILDVNTTPGTPHPGFQISHSDFDRYTDRLAQVFAATFLAAEQRSNH